MVENKVTERDKEKVKELPEFKDLEILDTWFEDIWRLEEEIKEKQKYLRKVKRERKLQPTIQTVTILTNEETTTLLGYRIIITKSGRVGFCKD